MENSSKGIILSLGSVNADFQVRVDQPPGSTTTLFAHDFKRLSGGKAANVAYIARRLQAPAAIIARVGDDELQEQALRPLRNAGIDLSAIKKVSGASTAVSMIFVPPDGKKHIVLAQNANLAWTKAEAEEVSAFIAQAPEGSVLVADYEVPDFIVAAAIRTAHSRGFAVILDPSPASSLDDSLLPLVDYLLPDADETKTLTGIMPDKPQEALQAARILLTKGVQTAMVKLADGGCVLANQLSNLHIPPLSVAVVDTTGAGDAFAGALAVAVLEKQSLQQAACNATAASVAAVTAYGSQASYPFKKQLQELSAQLSTICKTIDEQS